MTALLLVFAVEIVEFMVGFVALLKLHFCGLSRMISALSTVIVTGSLSFFLKSRVKKCKQSLFPFCSDLKK